MIDLARRVQKLTGILDVAKALTAERDLDRLLPLIVEEAKKVVDADRCSLFVLDREKGELWSKVAQGLGTTVLRFPVGRGIAGAVAETGLAINIPDAYADARFNASFDKSTGYRTRSILAIPMRDNEGLVVGVVQALNKATGEPFDNEDEELLGAMGGQAAAAIQNALLHEEIQQLFEGFVRASVVAVEARDPATAGHSERVATLTVGIADALPRAGATAGKWKGVELTYDERIELRYAALLHDFGKVGVREHILVKANKLFPGDLEALRARFDSIGRTMEADILREKIEVMQREGLSSPRIKEIDLRLAQTRAEIGELWEFITACNRPTVLAEGSFERLGDIAARTYEDLFGNKKHLLTPTEVEVLSIRRGSLSAAEREEIESHVTHTYRFLSQIPWTRTLKRVPDIAYGHHEKLDGRGYPRKLPAESIPVQTRMMTISDIYDALTAGDRPYKKAMPRQKALDILADEAKQGYLDNDLLAVFIEADIPGARPK